MTDNYHEKQYFDTQQRKMEKQIQIKDNIYHIFAVHFS